MIYTRYDMLEDSNKRLELLIKDMEQDTINLSGLSEVSRKRVKLFVGALRLADKE